MRTATTDTLDRAIAGAAIFRHVGELKAAKPVAAGKAHRQNPYRLSATPLRPLIAWLDGFPRLMGPDAGSTCVLFNLPLGGRR